MSPTILRPAVALLVSLLPLAAQAGDPSPARQAQLLDLLRQDCGSCHGLTLRGGLGPSLEPASLADKPAALIAATILDGRPGTAMPPWRGILNDLDARWLSKILIKGVPRQ